ncbi:hypothetical protein PC116_g29932 [Phytophthora cactorum]|nr:hypothetical protein PC116_g29932 [Phytophthora cactorum]
MTPTGSLVEDKYRDSKTGWMLEEQLIGSGRT